MPSFATGVTWVKGDKRLFGCWVWTPSAKAFWVALTNPKARHVLIKPPFYVEGDPPEWDGWKVATPGKEPAPKPPKGKRAKLTGGLFDLVKKKQL